MTLKTKQNFEFDNITFKYDPKTKWVNVKISKEKGRIKQNDLWMMTFMISKERQQDDMMPDKDRDMMQFVRQHQIRATKDIKAGEMITVNCNVNVPMVVVDSLLKERGVEPKEVLLPTTKLEQNAG